MNLDEGFEEVPLNNQHQLDDGFEPVPLDQGFEPVAIGGELSLPEVVQQETSAEKPAEVLPEVSQKQALLKGLQQGTTMGFSDEISGGVQSTADRMQRLLNQYTGLVGKSPTQVSEEMAQQGFQGDLGPTSPSELYEQGKAEDRKDIEAAQQQHPATFMAGDLGGGLLTSVPGGALAKGASKAIPQIANMGKVAKGAVSGATMGAVEGAGRTDKDLMSVEGATDVATGAALGGGLGATIGKFSKTQEAPNLMKQADNLMEEADEQAMRSIGAGNKDVSDSLESAYKYNNPKNTGITAIEEGIVDPMSRPKEVYKKALEVKQGIQQGYDDILDRFEDRINLSEKQADSLSKQYYVRIKDKVDQAISGNDTIPPEMKNTIADDLSQMEVEILEALDSSNPIKNLQEMYTRYNDVFFKNVNSPSAPARKAMRNEIKNIQRQLADVIEGGTKKEFKDLDDRYTALLDIEGWAKNAAGKKQTIGMGDVIKGATARLTGIPGAGELVTGASVASKKILGKDLTDVLGGRAAISKYNKAQRLKEYAGETASKGLKESVDDAEGLFNKMSAALDSGRRTASKAGRQAIEANPEAASTAGVAGGTAIADAIAGSSPVQEPYQQHQQVARIMEKATPEMLNEQANVIRTQYGKPGELLATELDDMAKKDVSARRASMFKILSNPVYKRMLMSK